MSTERAISPRSGAAKDPTGPDSLARTRIMIPPDQSGFELLEQALKAGVRISFRRSIPSQIASLLWAPVFTWVLWKGAALHLPFAWIFLAALWVSWYFYLQSPHKMTVQSSLVSVHWWFRRVTVARNAVSLEPRPTATSRLFGYDLIAVGEVGKFPIWPAYFIVTQHAAEVDGSRRD